MHVSVKKALYYVCIALIVLLIGFTLSSGMVSEASRKFIDNALSDTKDSLHHHISNLEVDAKHYFILPVGGYEIKIFLRPTPFSLFAALFLNSIFNIIFQPVFFCVFTPQAVINILLFPFFLYGAVRYYKKVWPILIMFFVLSFNIGIYDSTVEALIRHGMICELLYLLTGLTGFSGLITKS